jgi:PAS domain S-box-containing protein
MIGYVNFMWPLIVGIGIYAAITHLLIGLRRPIDRLHVLLGGLALCVVVFVIGNIRLATAQTPAQYQSALWIFSVAWLSFFILLPWFVAEYGRDTKHWLTIGVSGAYGVILIANLFSPHTIFHSAPPSLYQYELPWEELLTRSSTPGTAWTGALSAMQIVAIGYLIYACVALFRRGPRARAWSLAFSTLPFAVSLTFNLLVTFGAIDFSYIAAPGFMALVVVMSVGLTREWRRSHAQMQAVLDNLPAIVYLKRTDGKYVFVNHHFEQLHRRAADSVLGKTDAELFEPARAAKSGQVDRDALAGSVVQWEEAVADGNRTRIYASTCFALRDAHQSPYALCGIATDITERKSAADSLQYLASNLERRVARRTSELARLNQELEAFAYSVSHDLRAPLTAVNGFADLLLREHSSKLDQNGHRYLQRIREGSLRMGTLIQDLLGLSRVSQQSLRRESVNLAALFTDSLKALREAHPLRQVDVQVQDSMPASGDVNLLAMVTNNILGNAWKYTAKTESARIEIGTRQQDGDTVFYVKDNGAGFDPQYAERLFRPFVRLHSEQEFPGTGIGLATAARIVSKHGGRIWAEGARGQGATFYFTLPMEDEGP